MFTYYNILIASHLVVPRIPYQVQSTYIDVKCTFTSRKLELMNLLQLIVQINE